MTYREYLEKCDDEYEKIIIMANLAREYPLYYQYSESTKKRIVKELLDREMVVSEE